MTNLQPLPETRFSAVIIEGLRVLWYGGIGVFCIRFRIYLQSEMSAWSKYLSSDNTWRVPMNLVVQPLYRVLFGQHLVHSLPKQPRILVMDYRIPMADVSAGERATVGILKDLVTFGYDVVFLPSDMVPAPEYEATLVQLGVTVVTHAEGYISLDHFLWRHGHSFTAFYLTRVDVVESVLKTIRRVAPCSKVIFHAPDVYFLRETREAEHNEDPILRTKADVTRMRELACMQEVDHNVIISPAELSILRQYLPDAPMSLFPGLYVPVVSAAADYSGRKDFFFLGGFGHTPNVDAVCWFVAEIWPLVQAQLPDCVFHIVGSEAPRHVLQLAAVPGVVVDGFVKDLDPFLSSIRVGVAPLRFGAGVKGKVAMTMGAGVPCVCTTIAAEGMGIEDGVHALVADDPLLIAKALVRLYTDPDQWSLLSAGGRDLVKHRFGEEANMALFLGVLNEAKVLPLQLFINYCRSLNVSPATSPSNGEMVDVSIIVPVFNQWEFTRACLNSIFATCTYGDVRYEVILADDGSADETVDATGYFPGLRVIRTPSNIGFLRNCNNAAKHARGRYILLLNNDTIVLPGWLSSLYRVMETDASAAIVGSKLLYPDGTLQEAGAVLWNDGTASNCGRGRAATASEWNYLREVDYISGASILIRKSFWEKAGGFDERYENAYCEDCDLAMTARELGYRVVFQPLSEVVHFEHQSYADQAPSGNAKLQKHNTALLLEKWNEMLSSQHLPSTSPCHLGISNAERSASATALSRRSDGRLKILYFSPFPSHPSSHGNRATISQFARCFQSLGHTVHFVLLQNGDCTDDGMNEMRSSWDTLDLIPYANPMVANGKPIAFDGWYEDGLGEQIGCLCAKYDIDVVICSYVFQSKILEFVPARILKVIDTHDKMGNRYEMLRENGQPLEFFSCTPEAEGAYLRRADVVVAKREEEARYFDSVTGNSSAIVISHLEEPHFVDKAFAGLGNVGMVASANQINLAITRECLEAMDRQAGAGGFPFTVHVAGQIKDMIPHLPDCAALIFKKPWVRMHGFIADIAEFYAGMDLIVSPVTMGTGINIKTVQAMAFGMPLLTTICGSKGIETDEPMHSHLDLDALAEALFSLTSRPDELERLAGLSRSRYGVFYQANLASLGGLMAHPKLKGTRAL